MVYLKNRPLLVWKIDIFELIINVFFLSGFKNQPKIK